MKVEDMIKRIRRGPMREIAYQIWQLCYQYAGERDIGMSQRTGQFIGQKVNRQQMDRFGIDFIPVGTSMKMNKELDKMLDLELINTITNPQNAPIFAPTLQNPQATRELAESIIRDWGGDWPSKLDKLLPSEEQVREEQVQVEMEAQRRLAAEQQYIEQRQAEGIPEQQIMAELEQLRAEQAQTEGQGQGQRQGGVTR